jgi:hypothetical protein
MKITRDPERKVWMLTSDSAVLYQGRASPWDHPAILREAQQRESELKRRGPRANGPTRAR